MYCGGVDRAFQGGSQSPRCFSGSFVHRSGARGKYGASATAAGATTDEETRSEFYVQADECAPTLAPFVPRFMRPLLLRDWETVQHKLQALDDRPEIDPGPSIAAASPFRGSTDLASSSLASAGSSSASSGSEAAGSTGRGCAPRGSAKSGCTDSACALDAQLRSLAHADGRYRIVFGEACTHLLKSRSYTHLGFARLGDYTSERLGIGERSVQDASRVARALGGLVHLRDALAEGFLSWSRVRLLVRVATADDETDWIELARRATTAELTEQVQRAREQRTGQADTAGPQLAPATVPHDDDYNGDDVIDGEAKARFSLRCPHSTTKLWRHTVEVASRLEGGPIAQWKAAELASAEVLSSVSPQGTKETELDVTDGALSHESLADRSRAPRNEDGIFEPLDPSQPWTDIVTGLGKLARGLAMARPRELDERLRLILHVEQAIDFRLSGLLLPMLERRLYRELGFDTFAHYVETRLGISVRRARSLVSMERKSGEAGVELRRAWREGRLSLLAASALSPVLRRETVGAWIERAGIVTLRRLRDEVEWALNRQGEEQPGRAASAPLPPPLDARLRTDDGTLLRELDEHERQIGAHGAEPGSPTTPGSAPASGLSPPYPARHPTPHPARVQIFGPQSVIRQLELAMRALTEPGMPRWCAFERVLLAALRDWLSVPRHRDPVFARDGWRCSVPACTGRANLHDHHIEPRSRGGSNAPENRAALCAAHHLYGVHGGRVKVFGRAPDDLTWELGSVHGREPFARLYGDRYIATSEGAP